VNNLNHRFVIVTLNISIWTRDKTWRPSLYFSCSWVGYIRKWEIKILFWNSRCYIL